MVRGKLGVMIAGVLGNIATTVIAGTLAIQKEIAPKRGLITESDIVGKLPLVPLDNILFGGWDIREADLYQATAENGIISPEIVSAISGDLRNIAISTGITANIDNITQQVYGVRKVLKDDLPAIAAKIQGDIESFKTRTQAQYVIVVNLLPTEPPVPPELYHWELADFENGLRGNDNRITPSMIYNYAALLKGCGFINFTPSVNAELPALCELALKTGSVTAGKDGKTGQTLYKTVLATMFRARQLKILGWYSTNILGNTDGAILASESHRKSKVESKLGGLSGILGYDDIDHQVRIDYYRPRGDNKEAWDNIDFEGWLGQKMCMKINWIGSDSILAAPLIIDLARLVEYAAQCEQKGMLTHLGIFFKSPYGKGTEVCHEFFVQLKRFEDYVGSESRRSDFI